MPLLNASYYQAEISRILRDSGQTVQLDGGGSCPLRRETNNDKTIATATRLGGSDSLAAPVVWYATAADYVTYFGSGNAQGKRFTHRSVQYRVVNIEEEEDGDILQHVTILTDRGSP